MHKRSRTPLIPASNVNRISENQQSGKTQPTVQTSGMNFEKAVSVLISSRFKVSELYPNLVRDNMSLAKENARLKKLFRDLSDRKLQLEMSRTVGMISKSSGAPGTRENQVSSCSPIRPK